MFRTAFFLCLFLAAASVPVRAQGQGDALTRFIAAQVLDSVRHAFPEAPASITVRKTASLALYRGDTLNIPADLWGYAATNDYRLHFFAAFLLYRECRARRDGEKSAEAFVRNAGRASRDALALVATYERKDSLLEPLLVREYLRSPFFSGGPDFDLGRFWNVDSLRYRCMLKAALGWRADSNRLTDWVASGRFSDYSITAADQKPRKGRFDVRLTLRNAGTLDLPLECYADLAKGPDTLLKIPGFLGDKTIQLSLSAPLLKLTLDPACRLYDPDEKGHAFISPQFRNQRKVWFMLALLLWDLISGFAAFAFMLVLGIFIHSLGTLFFDRHAVWTAIFTLVLVVFKLAFPLVFYGFTLWGLVYPVAQISGMVPMSTLAACTAAAAGLVYWAFQKDGARVHRFGVFAAYIAVYAAVEPLFTGIFIFFKL